MMQTNVVFSLSLLFILNLIRIFFPLKRIFLDLFVFLLYLLDHFDLPTRDYTSIMLNRRLA